ncbi:MAG: DNA-directed RNA polymerase subunit beta' [Candidatus Berkelbacteria bacterium]|nr:DNA-directed RNA polymerase subunit beta' [Candidatus Berkelbacteria bacterium]
MAELKLNTKPEKAEFSLLNFEGLRLRVASPEDIEKWSYGEVMKPETINYRTQKPERDGLFDERIFGPTKDWECYCGKYKRIRYKGVICDKCGVEVTRSSVRRERMGHIDLAVPVAHIWYVRGVPYILSTILDISVSDLEKVIYFASFVVTGVDEQLKAEALSQLESEYKSAKEMLKDSVERLEQLELNYKQTKSDLQSLLPRQILPEAKFHEISLRFGNIIKVAIGAEAILELLKKIDLDAEISAIKAHASNVQSNTYRRLMKRLRVLTDMKLAGIRADWLIIGKLPVLPPDLRPMVQLDGGRFASSDLNDLYRRVLNRNNRLKRLMNQGAPDVIVRNEKRMLQEAVDALIDNSARKGQTTAGGRQPRSLSDMLRGKQGRFRQNLLGKRVDYSGRSVIVVGPRLKLDQCGLPKVMALELFKPFVISKLISEGYVHNVKNASRLIDRGTPEVWEILESVTKGAHVLLNRAPTLHRLGIQAFSPLLIEGKAIQLHPLVCAAYNADFDGDQMAVHVPLSTQARQEAGDLMLSSHNLLKPASGEPLVTPRLDIVFGIFYLTNEQAGVEGEGRAFASTQEVDLAYQRGNIHPQAKIQLRMSDGKRIDTTVGRALLNAVLPEGYVFINEPLDTKRLKVVIRHIYKIYGQAETARVADDLMQLGFKFAEKSGMTMSISDVHVPEQKGKLIAEGEEAVDEIMKRYRRGLITDDERRKLTIEKWTEIRNRIQKEVMNDLPKSRSIFTMVSSGARGSSNQMTQLSGMKGLVVNPAGGIIEVPIISNYKEGLSVLEYFISTHGSRKGKSDTSLKTADAGYLTRRLVDVAQDLVITIEDCKSERGNIVRESESQEYGESFLERLLGRVSMETVKSKDGKVILKAGQEITEEIVAGLNEVGKTELLVRSALYCRAPWGICQKCYGRDLASGEIVKVGTAVGIMAAQAIGEPGTQLTMKTFHMGGVSVGDITSGLPRVEEIFEARPPHNPAILAEISGKALLSEHKDKQLIEIISDDIPKESFVLIEDYQLSVKNGDVVKAKQAVATAIDKKAIRSNIGGRVNIKGKTITVTSLEPVTVSYTVSPDINVSIKNGDMVEKGAKLTDGHIDLGQSLDLRGLEATQAYIIKEVQNIYASHGAAVNEKHIEIIARAMFAKVRVLQGGDSTFLTGQVIDKLESDNINLRLKKEKAVPIDYEQIVLGITRASLNTKSFLSAASFQETTSVLIKAAMKGQVDPLRGLKENVIIGKLIPAGTGYGVDVKIDPTEVTVGLAAEKSKVAPGNKG